MQKRRMAAYRLPFETIAQIEVLAAELQRRSPGKVSQADAIAWAVARAVAELDGPGQALAAPPAPPPIQTEYEVDQKRKSRATAGPPTLQTKPVVGGIGAPSPRRPSGSRGRTS